MASPLARFGTHVLFQSVAEGGVLLDTKAETYFGLNAVGARVCELLPAHATVESLCAELQRDYPEVSAAQLRADIDELFDALEQHGLLQRDGGGVEEGTGDHAGIPAT